MCIVAHKKFYLKKRVLSQYIKQYVKLSAISGYFTVVIYFESSSADEMR